MAPASEPAFIHILGSRIDNIPSYRAAYGILIRACREDAGPGHITVNNAHTMVEGARRPAFRQIINDSLLSLADGRPLSIIGWLKGAREMHRIFGPTLLEKVLEWGQADGVRHFFFGNTPETLEKMRTVITQRYPKAIIAGMIAPPFRAFTEAENGLWLETMRAARPDLIWVSLGAPRQEEWISQHFRSLDCGLCIGIGAGFSYLAGTIRHAPAWMKYMALEWFYRLLQEPNRLWRRYVKNNTLFILYMIRELLTGAHDQARVSHEIEPPQDQRATDRRP
ncbi:MAG TPA: WecB/TagA/CpsF family glycosyltransferase [bacterium]|nr:WecB/TagA/CpsF family glycosyltransferase [bacterium]HPR89451.1 WecB/TagA/CpsF family glycosyltransferase [bacterium]